MTSMMNIEAAFGSRLGGGQYCGTYVAHTAGNPSRSLELCPSLTRESLGQIFIGNKFLKKEQNNDGRVRHGHNWGIDLRCCFRSANISSVGTAGWGRSA